MATTSLTVKVSNVSLFDQIVVLRDEVQQVLDALGQKTGWTFTVEEKST